MTLIDIIFVPWKKDMNFTLLTTVDVNQPEQTHEVFCNITDLIKK